MEHSRPLSVAPTIVVLAALAVLAGCGGDGAPPAEPEPTPHPGLAPGTHRFTTVDDVEMPYTVTGDGETTVLMVHCWMCQGDFWDAQVPVVAERFRTIVVDLPGHGDAGDDRESWSIAGYGADIADLIKHLDLERVVLVGHSMGGPVSLRAAALAGDRVIGVIAVETLHDAEFDFDQPAVEQMIAAFETDFPGMCNRMVEQMFVEDGVDDVRAEVRRVGCEESNQEAGLALMHDFAALDLAKLFSEAGVPIRAINAAEPNPTQIETNRKYADFDAVLMDGVGHYLHMTRPDEFNALLLEQLDRLVGTPTA